MIRRHGSTAVFLGPSLRRDEARSLLAADLYPPACKGDVYRIMASGVETIVLIDGLFHSTPSVWQRELLDAIDEGIRVMGASSMGALRAAELHRFGMIGYGTIFEWYRDGIIDGDDEVALLHGTEDSDFRPLSEPLVNIRCTLLRAVEAKCLAREQEQELIAYAKSLYYPERSYRGLLESPVVRGWPEHQAARLKRYLSTRATNLKRLDAIGLLKRCAAKPHREGNGRAPERESPASVPIRPTRLWNYERLLLSGFADAHGGAIGAEVLERAHEDPALFGSLRPVLSRQHFLLQWARQRGVRCPEDVLKAFTKNWEAEHRTGDRAGWLRANGLTQDGYRVLLAERALFHWMTTQGPESYGLKRSFILDWAQQNGVSRRSGQRGRTARPTEKALEAWIVRQGPEFFGLDWNFEEAVLQDLQVTGRAARLIAKAKAND